MYIDQDSQKRKDLQVNTLQIVPSGLPVVAWQLICPASDSDSVPDRSDMTALGK